MLTKWTISHFSERQLLRRLAACPHQCRHGHLELWHDERFLHQRHWLAVVELPWYQPAQLELVRRMARYASKVILNNRRSSMLTWYSVRVVAWCSPAILPQALRHRHASAMQLCRRVPQAGLHLNDGEVAVCREGERTMRSTLYASALELTCIIMMMTTCLIRNIEIAKWAELCCSFGLRKCKDVLRISYSSLSCSCLHIIDLLPAYHLEETPMRADLPLAGLAI